MLGALATAGAFGFLAAVGGLAYLVRCLIQFVDEAMGTFGR